MVASSMVRVWAIIGSCVLGTFLTAFFVTLELCRLF